jgi:hypothetical protein
MAKICTIPLLDIFAYYRKLCLTLAPGPSPVNVFGAFYAIIGVNREP